MQIKLAGFISESIVDGPGYRFAVFAQGCPHNCPGCHNPHTHNYDGGELYDTDKIAELIHKNKLCDGVTFTGGEPFEQAEAFCNLARSLEGYNIYCFSGYTFEELAENENPSVKELLNYIDVLVDGRFIKEEFNYKLKFKGSKNQRTLDCKESVKQGKAVELT